MGHAFRNYVMCSRGDWWYLSRWSSKRCLKIGRRISFTGCCEKKHRKILKCLLAASVALLLLVFLQWVKFLNFFLRPKFFVTYSLLPVSLLCRLGSAALGGHVRFLGFRRESDDILFFFPLSLLAKVLYFN